MTQARRSALVGAYATFALFTLLAGQFWRNLLGWWGFGVVAALVVIGAAWMVLEVRPKWSWRRVPKSTLAFLLIATASIAWSFYPGASALGVLLTLMTVFVGVALAICLTWARFARALGAALKWVLGLSLVFELWAAIFVRGPVLPFFPDFDVSAYEAAGEKLPMAFYWSRGLLFSGGPIEGIVANRNLLAMAALLGVILFGTLTVAGTMRRAPGVGWLVVAALTLALTRSATVMLAGALVVVALVFAVWARRLGPERRRRVYVTAVLALVASVAALAAGWGLLLRVFGKGEDLTGRLDIWNSVIGLALERPWFGWGWVGYWNPWVEPFDDLAVRKGVTYLQAHDAWLDVWMQLGILGLIAFVSIVIGALWRSWFLAVDPPMDASGRRLPHTAASLAPLLLLVALIGQSFAESRLLVESGLALLIVIAWSTKLGQWRPDPMPAEAPPVPALRRPPAGPPAPPSAGPSGGDA